MALHRSDTCEERSDCPDLAEHWGQESMDPRDGEQTAVDASYFLAFVLGDNTAPPPKLTCDGKGPWSCEGYIGFPCDC